MLEEEVDVCVICREVAQGLECSLVQFSCLVFTLYFEDVYRATRGGIPLGVVGVGILFVSLRHPCSGWGRRGACSVLGKGVFVGSRRYPCLQPRGVGAFVNVNDERERFLSSLLPNSNMSSTINCRRRRRRMGREATRAVFVVLGEYDFKGGAYR